MKHKHILFSLMLYPTLCAASSEIPRKSVCTNKQISASIADIHHCIDRTSVTNIETLGGSIPTTHFKYSNGLEYSVAYIPSKLATNGLHTKYNMSVKSFFSALYEKNSPNDKFQLIRSAYNIDSENKLIKFKHKHFDVYGIIGTSVFDSLYIVLENDEFLYQISGNFSELEANNILDKLELKKI
ncbi:hypothetical protein HR060_15265 [Catenovulum sp. SM1970]|uniref:hypothetical protein n=1 Tax=Marinifaba aquimaris TaxID=2741323 RepID=UPI001571C684|nr:hypothetical protein [Marinifaba aquimaris]NTS78210.1 hypothetical protein [Marinifaba aquimaris]